MKDYMKIYQEWLANPYFDEKTKEELRAIANDENEIKERFYMDLEFGTAGLRGIIGAGINRMNIYTVRRATQGLANYIIKQGGADKGVAIAFDSRHMSPEFAMEAAMTLAANGIKAYKFESLRPTPELSFAVRELGCIELLEEIVMQGRELVQFVTDFTWYLRNLMLVQTADNLEDVIDMSTDNLANLKEEASMLAMDQIIRYIHIFSELSGQIRYAAQKRVLVEVALVKLCKPQMEQNLESVLERLRILEEKMERGIPMMVTNAPGAGNGSAGGSGAAGDGYAAAETPQSAPAPVKAAPADLQRISASWKAIVGQTSGMFRQFLQSAVPKYNSETGDAKLFVEFADQLASIYVERPEAADEIRTIIEQMTGKTVEVQLILADQHANAALSTISVDDALTQAIHGIPVEEDDESDFDDGEE